MRQPSRAELADALIALIERSGGKIDVAQSCLFGVLAEQFGLEDRDLGEVYEIRGGRRVGKWEQTVRVLKSDLARKGVFVANPARGTWMLSPLGRRLAAEINARPTVPTSAPLRTVRDAFAALGLAVQEGNAGAILRSPLPGIVFEALLVEIRPDERWALPRTDMDLMIVPGDAIDRSSLLLPEGVMVAHESELRALAQAHRERPYPLDFLVQLFQRTALGDEGAIARVVADAAKSERLAQAMGLVVEFACRHIEAGRTEPFTADHVAGFSFASGEAKEALSKGEIQEAIATLAAPRVGMLRDGDVGYLLTLTPESARRWAERFMHRSVPDIFA